MLKLPHFWHKVHFPRTAFFDGVIFPILSSNFSGFGPHSSRGTSLKLSPCEQLHWAFEWRTLSDLFTPCPAEVIAMYMEKSLNLGKGLVSWLDGVPAYYFVMSSEERSHSLYFPIRNANLLKVSALCLQVVTIGDTNIIIPFSNDGDSIFTEWWWWWRWWW